MKRGRMRARRWLSSVTLHDTDRRSWFWAPWKRANIAGKASKVRKAGKRARDWGNYKPLHPITLAVGTLVLLLLVLAAGAWMWSTALDANNLPLDSLTPAEQVDIALRRTQIQLDAIRNALGVAAALGAVVALLLALRRQYVKERVDRDDLYVKQRTVAYAEVDATEKRITELYVKAAEQLGSEKAPIRMAGIYALERLADDTPGQRQTIVDLLCAYLRMPFNPSDIKVDLAASEIESDEQRTKLDIALREREVRLTIQSVLRRHLYQPDFSQPSSISGSSVPSSNSALSGVRPIRWDGVALNLAGASLLDLDFSSVEVDRAVFDGAVFFGKSMFSSSRWDHATFIGATFAGLADFREVQASVLAMSGSTFVQSAWFENVRCKVLDAIAVVFQSDSGFENAYFYDKGAFDSSLFLGNVGFDGARFGVAAFEGSLFGGRAGFPRCSFHDSINFRKATFDAEVEFEGSLVVRASLNRHVLPTGWSVGHYVGAESSAVVRFLGIESEPEDDYPTVIAMPSSQVGCCVRGGGTFGIRSGLGHAQFF